MMGCHKNIVAMVIELVLKNGNQKTPRRWSCLMGKPMVETSDPGIADIDRYCARLRLPSSNKMESHSWDNHLSASKHSNLRSSQHRTIKPYPQRSATTSAQKLWM